MQSLACRTCGAGVFVAKYSPAHTSVQWTTESAQTCPEMAAAAGGSAYLLRCEALDRTIDEAATRGAITPTTRSEPDVEPLAAAEVRTISR